MTAGPRLLEELQGRRRGPVPRGPHRARALCEELGSPHLATPAIRVVGTDGKTSVVRLVAALLDALGIRARDTTSPHLRDVRERIRVGDRPVAAARLADACAGLPAALAAAEARTGEAPTFFDAVTAVAMRAFADADVDVAIVEAGIGGVGDATSVVSGRATVCMPVGLDHPELGATRAEVAAEKAAVTAPGGLLVAAPQVPAASAVLARIAAARGATLLRAGHDFGVQARRPVPGGQVVDLRGLHGSRLRTTLPLLGAHQAGNAAVALATVQAWLATTDLPTERLRAGFAGVRVPGRVEPVRRAGAASVVLDGAHDPLAVGALAAVLRELAPRGPCVAVLGVSGDRDPAALAAPLRALTPTLVVTAADCPGAVPAARVAARLRDAGHAPLVAAAPADALALASRLAGRDGLVVVTGSLHLVAEARAALAGGAA